MDYSSPGSSVCGILQGRVLEWVVHALLQGIFPTEKSNLGLLHCGQILYPLSHPPTVAYSFPSFAGVEVKVPNKR